MFSIANNCTYGRKYFRIDELVECVAALQLPQRERPHLAEGMGKSFVGELVLERGFAGVVEFEPQDG